MHNDIALFAISINASLGTNIVGDGLFHVACQLISVPDPLTNAANGLHHRYAERGSEEIA